MGIQLWMVFEAVAPDKEGLEASLTDHIEKLESEDELEITSKEVDEITEVKNPHPNLDEGYSKVAEIEAEVEKFSKAVSITINYGPTYVQIEGPEEIEIEMKDGQDALQKVANTMHQYAQQGAGGVVISKASQQEKEE